MTASGRCVVVASVTAAAARGIVLQRFGARKASPSAARHGPCTSCLHDTTKISSFFTLPRRLTPGLTERGPAHVDHADPHTQASDTRKSLPWRYSRL
eukprot:5176290-Prymnesium_polylepis.1